MEHMLPMSGAEDLPAALSWEQICELHPDEWVCLADMDWVNETDFNLCSARVLGHGKTRKEPLAQARSWLKRYPSIGHFFTGSIRASLR
jgi:hypothetical protein